MEREPREPRATDDRRESRIEPRAAEDRRESRGQPRIAEDRRGSPRIAERAEDRRESRGSPRGPRAKHQTSATGASRIRKNRRCAASNLAPHEGKRAKGRVTRHHKKCASLCECTHYALTHIRRSVRPCIVRHETQDARAQKRRSAKPAKQS